MPNRRPASAGLFMPVAYTKRTQGRIQRRFFQPRKTQGNPPPSKTPIQFPARGQLFPCSIGVDPETETKKMGTVLKEEN
jgi:hypothetical protein